MSIALPATIPQYLEQYEANAPEVIGAFKHLDVLPPIVADILKKAAKYPLTPRQIETIQKIYSRWASEQELKKSAESAPVFGEAGGRIVGLPVKVLRIKSLGVRNPIVGSQWSGSWRSTPPQYASYGLFLVDFVTSTGSILRWFASDKALDKMNVEQGDQICIKGKIKEVTVDKYNDYPVTMITRVSVERPF